MSDSRFLRKLRRTLRSRALRYAPWLAACSVLLLAAPARAQVYSLRGVANFVDPVYVTHAGDSRLFVVEQRGVIRVYSLRTRRTLRTPFLNIDAKVLSGGERGLLSMAFHPDYAQNGLFYVNYTDNNGDTVIERYRVSAQNPDVADANSGRTLLKIAQPFANHNGGQLQIHPQSGYLYVGMGDGGSGGDPMCTAQRSDSLLGKMLRLDVRQNLDREPYYGIPADNPFINDPAVDDTVWARGLRNPWRFWFDRLRSDLYIADVGQNNIEEIDREPATSSGGVNWGWKVMEGSTCLSNAACPQSTPLCHAPELELPIYEYPHAGEECSITGGYVYRGTRAPALDGRYVFADFCSAKVRALREASPGVFSAELLLDAGSALKSFGEDASGNLYVVHGNRVSELVSRAR